MEQERERKIESKKDGRIFIYSQADRDRQKDMRVQSIDGQCKQVYSVDRQILYILTESQKGRQRLMDGMQKESEMSTDTGIGRQGEIDSRDKLNERERESCRQRYIVEINRQRQGNLQIERDRQQR